MSDGLQYLDCRKECSEGNFFLMIHACLENQLVQNHRSQICSNEEGVPPWIMQIDKKPTPAKSFFYSPLKKKINFTHVKVLGLFQDCNVVYLNGY